MLTQFICPDNTRVGVEACLDKCIKEYRCASLSFLQMAASEREWTGKPSVTQLLNGTRLEMLKITEDYAIKPTEKAFMILGSRAHARLEDEQNDKTEIEQRLEIEGITGQYDCLENEHGRYKLIDAKTTGSYKVRLALFEQVDGEEEYVKGPKKGTKKQIFVRSKVPNYEEMDEWIMQTNMYRLMVEKEKKIKVDEIYIFIIVRDGGTKNAIMNGVKDNTYMVKVPILEDNLILEYFRDKRDKLLTALMEGDCDKCNDVETWNGRRCNGYCPVKEYCI